eukprot:10089578-Alexandrium_andersonii.AAC.1
MAPRDSRACVGVRGTSCLACPLVLPCQVLRVYLVQCVACPVMDAVEQLAPWAARKRTVGASCVQPPV